MGFWTLFVQTHNGFLFLGKTRQSDFPEYPPPSGLTYLSELLNYEDSNGEEFTVLVTSNEIIFDYFSKKRPIQQFFCRGRVPKIKRSSKQDLRLFG